LSKHKQIDVNKPISVANEAAAVSWSIEQCEVRLGEYPTTLAEDEALVAGSASDVSRTLSPHLLMALMVRVGEKEVLIDTISKLKSK
jgi:hypothetical protein